MYMKNMLHIHEHEILTVEERTADSRVVFGFWMYLMTDFVLFATLFAVYAVLRNSTYGGLSGAQLFDLPYVLIETILLLSSSFTCGLALLAARAGSTRLVILSLGATALLGASFVFMEVSEFARLISAGNTPQLSGFLSSYFTLVGTHGLHVTIGLVWILALIIAIAAHGLTRANMRKLMLFSLFWHFLDIVWIFIFTIVYLMAIH
jgi:cytochrome o ubiquinol oxidase subunit 3